MFIAMPLGLIIGGIISSLFAGVASMVNSSKQRQQSRELFEEDYQNQMDLMNLQNTYNSPSNQVSMMKDAGLNPDLQQIAFQPSAGAELPSAMNIPTGTALGDVANGLMPIVNGALDMLQRDKDLHMSDLKLDSQMSDNIQQEDLFLSQFIASSMPEDLLAGANSAFYDDFADAGVFSNFIGADGEYVSDKPLYGDDARKAASNAISGWWSQFISDMETTDPKFTFGRYGFSRKQAKRMLARLRDVSMRPDMQEQMFRTYHDLYAARQDYDTISNSPLSRKTGDPVPDAILSISALTADNLLSALELEGSQISYQSDTITELSEAGVPALSADAQVGDLRASINESKRLQIAYDVCNGLLTSDSEVSRYFGVYLMSQLSNGGNPLGDFMDSLLSAGIDTIRMIADFRGMGKGKGVAKGLSRPGKTVVNSAGKTIIVNK